MFTGGRKGYQVIDDDYEDTPSSMIGSILPTVSNARSHLFNGAGSESQPLVDNSRPYQTAPGIEETAPSNMNSSSSREQAQRWNHIGHLDEFFTHIYEYQQEGGFSCIVAKKIGSLIFFGFITFFATFATQCVDYDVLFANKNTSADGMEIRGKKHIGDAIIGTCTSQLNPFIIICLLIATIFYVFKIVRTCKYLLQMKEIQDFYTYALGISAEKLSSLTWYDVLKKLCEAQSKLQLSVNNPQLNPIDIYHRILRAKNYMVAMINQRILPPVFNVPLVGKVAYLPNGLKYNLSKCLFRSTNSPWNGPILKQEFKDYSNLNKVTTELEQQVVWFALANFALMPFIFIYQLLRCLVWIAEWIKKNPAEIGARRYSNYGRYRVRHFQELNHELLIRLNRSHRFANHYMNQFFSPLTKVVAQNVRMTASIVLGYLVVLSVWDEDTLQVEHVVTVIAGLGVVLAVCTGLIPDDTMVYQPEALMTRVTSELQYLPSEWKGKAHQEEIRREFEEVFQAKWMFLVHELTSPIVTPFILWFWLRPLCRDIISFFREYTTTISGTGDVCSFAILDVAIHGDPHWNGQQSIVRPRPAFDGKTEMSALNFMRLIPEWKPPAATDLFINQFKSKLNSDAADLVRGAPATLNKNRLLESVHSLLLNKPGPARQPKHEGFQRIITPLEEVEPVPAVPRPNSLIDSLRQSGIDLDEDAGADMRVQTLYLRGIHDEFRQSMGPSNYGTSVAPHTMGSIFDVPVFSSNIANEDSMINTTGPSRIIFQAPTQRYDEREEDVEEHATEAEHEDEDEERPTSSFMV